MGVGIESNGKILAGTTLKGKEIYIKVIKNTSMFGIEFGSGGELPETLTGAFTNYDLAATQVDRYLRQQVVTSNKKSE